ncbi:hypothetical protein PZH33_20150 [Blautia schinkii]|uniref:hypothetical protein n=1 Tax=Blautia schinkii TaxID=180164 RepID=UPI0023B105C3|nr:hypothetical protein [Blautia schinkii]MDE8682298.1 hypothetical protein [Blautia schinkii]
MREYCKTKENYKDCILFYRLGEFYEMFFSSFVFLSILKYLNLSLKFYLHLQNQVSVPYF